MAGERHTQLLSLPDFVEAGNLAVPMLFILK
jgi:hypothetical protein